MLSDVQTCRFCKRYMGSDEGVKYGVRHWAHFKCYLDAGKDLFKLPRHQVGRFPYKLLKARGLIDKIERTKRIGDLIGNW
jgi:hypothetical protein